MATLYSPRGGSARLRYPTGSSAHDGKPWGAPSAPALNNSSNDKEVMQNLNNRLASYLEKVSFLERSNKQLEIQIQEKLASSDSVERDFTDQYNLIHGLRKQIGDSVFENTRLLLAIDNSKLASDDFQEKLHSEFSIRQLVEKDTVALRKAKDINEAINVGLRADLDSLQNELLSLKADHEQEVKAVKESLSQAKVEVAVDAARGPDLQTVLSEIRTQYEDIIRKNKEEADSLFHTQYQAMTLQLAKEDEDARRSQLELRERRTVLQSLQLELDSAGNQLNVLRRDFGETEHRYKGELERLQSNIGAVEQDLSEVLRAVQSYKLDYKALWRIKVTLEAEIAEYRRLLDGETSEKIVLPEPKHPDIRTKKIVKIVTQTVVDGKIVGESSEVEEFENAEREN